MSHLSCCMEGNVLGIIEELDVEDSHEGGADLQVLVKIYEEENLGQALIENERKDEVFLSLINMADQIPYGSENKSLYSSIYWVDRNLFGMKTLGGKEFYFCNKYFVVTDIVLTCEQQHIFNLQPLDTFHTHAHEVNYIFFVLEDCVDNFDENQALGLFQKKNWNCFLERISSPWES